MKNDNLKYRILRYRVFRYRVFEIIEVSKDGDQFSTFYDWFMLAMIVLSLWPLGYKDPPHVFDYTDILTTVVFIIDYVLRFATADFKLKQGPRSFARYPFTGWAIVDLLSILPTITLLNESFKLFRLFRMARAARVLRVIKAMRYSASFRIISGVVKRSKNALSAVLVLAAGYIIVSALVIYSVEPDSFNTFFDAIYWATVSLTTVGYGDIYPVTVAGRTIAMISSIFGIAIVALPAGIITAGYMTELQEKDNREELENERFLERLRELFHSDGNQDQDPQC